MGLSSLRGNQFFDRILLFFMPQKFQPDYIYLRHVKLLKGKRPTWSDQPKNLKFSALVYDNPADLFWYSLCNQIIENCFNSISNYGCCYCWNKKNFWFHAKIIFAKRTFLAWWYHASRRTKSKCQKISILIKKYRSKRKRIYSPSVVYKISVSFKKFPCFQKIILGNGWFEIETVTPCVSKLV